MIFAPKKSLGQNFLINKKIINEIVKLGKINSQSTVLEIGPGTGNLTDEILKNNPKKFIAIEKDESLFINLKNKYKNNNLDLINKDVLDINWNNFLQQNCRKLNSVKLKTLISDTIGHKIPELRGGRVA